MSRSLLSRKVKEMYEHGLGKKLCSLRLGCRELLEFSHSPHIC